MSFNGFSSEGLKFLFENKLNNSKSWYEDHKNQYKNMFTTHSLELYNRACSCNVGNRQKDHNRSFQINIKGTERYSFYKGQDSVQG